MQIIATGLTPNPYIDTSRYMDTTHPIDAFSALAQSTRLSVFRLLVRCGPTGMRAGDIASELGVTQNTLSSHLGILARSGFVTSKRDGRSIIYTADMGGVRCIIIYLTQDCCQGQADICSELLNEILPSCS